MNALAVQNPRHKCDWETGTIIKQLIAILPEIYSLSSTRFFKR